MPDYNSISLFFDGLTGCSMQANGRSSVLMLLSIFVNSIVEILGLAFVVPVIGLVVQPEKILSNATLKSAFDVGAPLINTHSLPYCALFAHDWAFLVQSRVWPVAVNLFQTRFSFPSLTVCPAKCGRATSPSRSNVCAEPTQGKFSEINCLAYSFCKCLHGRGLLMMANEFCVDFAHHTWALVL